MDGVLAHKAVVDENTAATEEMGAGSAEVTQAIENIASVSEENSAAVEEVSASAEEMSAQVEEVTASAQTLSELAADLRQVVAQFTLVGKLDTAESTARTANQAARLAPTRAKALVGANGTAASNGHLAERGANSRYADLPMRQ